MIKKDSLINTLIGVLILVNSLLCFSLFYSLGRQAATKQITANISESGKIQIKVLEANTLKPIDGATVCIVETRHYENTNKYGQTSIIEVPIIRNQNFDLSLSRNWGELTILVYKSGYADNISFYQSLKPNTTKVGLTIFLSPIINEEDFTPTISLESPDQTWVESLIKLYKKRI